jgi:hypothetical protein
VPTREHPAEGSKNGLESLCCVLLVEALVLAELGFAHLTVGVAVAVLTATLHGSSAREDAHDCEHGEHTQTYVHVRKGIALLHAREPCPETLRITHLEDDVLWAEIVVAEKLGCDTRAMSAPERVRCRGVRLA